MYPGDGHLTVVRRADPGRYGGREDNPGASERPNPLISQGVLKGFDQTTNIILAESVERSFSLDEPPEDSPLGLYVIRGDNMCPRSTRMSDAARALVGEVDPQRESQTDWTSVRADPIEEVKH